MVLSANQEGRFTVVTAGTGEPTGRPPRVTGVVTTSMEAPTLRAQRPSPIMSMKLDPAAMAQRNLT